MASVKFIGKLKQWQIRWHITDPVTKKIESGSKLLPKRCTRLDADRFAEQIEEHTRQVKAGQAKLSDSVLQAIDIWLKNNLRHTERTQGLYKRIINKFQQGLPSGVRRITQLSASDIQNYINGLLSAGLKNRTCNAHLTAIKSFCRFCEQHYQIINVSRAVVMLKEDPPDARFLTESEYEKILATGSPAFRDRVSFAANTGLRVTELCNLRWADINGASITFTGKGRVRRIVPLNTACLEILERLKEKQKPKTNDEPVFRSQSLHGEDKRKIIPMTRSGFGMQCRSVAKKAGIECFGPHSLRHRFATELLIRGTPIAMVSRLLGHKSVRTTESVYIHVLPEHLRGLTDCLCEVKSE